MAGLYIHIPFCKTRCIYCDFFSSTESKYMESYVDALIAEMSLRKDELNEDINTIYIGGGTPSQLPAESIARIIESAKATFKTGKNMEITMEANPDDITPDFAGAVKTAGVNRISIGIQTFDDERLRFIRRRHDASTAIKAVETVKSAGIHNISIDLMYGFPSETLESWKEDINRALKLDVTHISAYSLMYEEGTPLHKMLSKGDFEEIDEELSLCMYKILIEKLKENGFTHYEISNFAKSGFHSRHNSSYWNSTPYIGIGAAAHSYDGKTRSWNPSNIPLYIIGVNNGNIDREYEVLTTAEKYNEMIMTRLRTQEGINIKTMKEYFEDKYIKYFLTNIKKHIQSGNIITNSEKHNFRLSKEGIFISNFIMSDLMITD